MSRSPGVRREVLKRLLKLNHEIHEQESKRKPPLTNLELKTDKTYSLISGALIIPEKRPQKPIRKNVGIRKSDNKEGV